MGHYASEMDYDDDNDRIDQLKKQGWSLVPDFLNPRENYNLRNQYNIKEISYHFYISAEDAKRLKKDIKSWLSL